VCARQSSASSQSLAIFSPRLAGVTVVLFAATACSSLQKVVGGCVKTPITGPHRETGVGRCCVPLHHSVAELLDFSFALVHLQTADCVPSRPSTRPTLSAALSIATPAPIRAFFRSFVRSFVVGLPCPPLLLPCAYLALLARRDNVLYRVCLAQPHSLTSSLLFTSSLTAILIFGALDYHRKRAGNISARLPANGSGGSLHLSSS